MDKLVSELNSIKDKKSMVLRSHLFIEYMINELIRDNFKEPEEILNISKDIGFLNKLKILKATGIFGDSEKGLVTLQNIIKINEIRNMYAHVFLVENIEGSLKKKINSLKLLKTIYFSEMEFKKEVYEERVKYYNEDHVKKLGEVSKQIIEVLFMLLK